MSSKVRTRLSLTGTGLVSRVLSPARWSRSDSPVGSGGADPLITPLIAVLVLVAAGLDALVLSRPGYLFGLTPDIGVWLGGTVRLLHGVIPYRNFLFDQPPGIMVILSPFAALSNLFGTRDGLAVLRLCTPVLAGINVLLVGRLVRHRGPLPTLVACGLMAVYPAELYALNAGLLEPITAACCLAGATLIFDRDSFAGPRRIALGGVLLGFAGAVKAPAIVPVLVIAVICASQLRQRLLPFVGGIITGFGVPSLPFLLLSAGAFIHDVVATQLARIPGSSRAPLALRLKEMTFGVGRDGAYVAAAVIAAVLVAGLAVSPRRPTPLAAFALASAVAVGAVQFITTQYYPQYPAFLIPFVAIAVALAVSRLTTRRLARLATVLVAATLAFLLVAQIGYIEAESTRDVASTVDSLVPSGACALSNNPQLLVTSDRFISSVTGCTVMVDPFGTMLAFVDNPSGGVATFRAALEHVDYLVLTSNAGGWLAGHYSSLQAYVGQNFHLVRDAYPWVYARDHPFTTAEAGFAPGRVVRLRRARAVRSEFGR